MTQFRTVNGVVEWFDTNGDPINPDGSPRSGPTLGELGGSDGSDGFIPPPDIQQPGDGDYSPPPPTTGGPLQPTSFANLNVQVTDAATGAPLPDTTVLISPDFGNGTQRTTDGAGFANFGVGVGYDVEINIIHDGYVNNDHIINIGDTSDHWYAIPLARETSSGGGGGGSKKPPPGVPPVVILKETGHIDPLDPVRSGLEGDPGPFSPATFELEVREGVPSLTARSFGALEIPGFGASPAGILAGIVSGIIGLFRANSGSADIGRLTGVVQNIGNLLLTTVTTLADLAARSVHTDTQGGNLFEHILGGVLGPIINALASVIRGGAGDLAKLFGPISDSIKKLVGVVRHIYDAWLRPIIRAIDTTRQILRVLEAFHLDWAAKADAALGRLEGKLSAPILLAIRKLNEVSNVVNRIVTLDGALQRVTLIKGLTKHATCVQRAIDQAPIAAAGTWPDKLTPLDNSGLLSEMQSNANAYASGGGGPWAEEFAALRAEIEQESAA